MPVHRLDPYLTLIIIFNLFFYNLILIQHFYYILFPTIFAFRDLVPSGFASIYFVPTSQYFQEVTVPIQMLCFKWLPVPSMFLTGSITIHFFNGFSPKHYIPKVHASEHFVLSSFCSHIYYVLLVLDPGKGACADLVERVAILEVKGPGPPGGVSERQLSPDRGGKKT